MNIVVVGAPGTGKSSLVQALRQALQADADTSGFTVTEHGAPHQPHPYDLTLLMGLDLPRHCAQPDPDVLRSDAHLRHTLGSQAIAYAVVYGKAQARTECALQAIRYHHKRSAKRPPSAAASGWHWNCETCSDAECEHRLFSALVKTSGSVRP
ncbi:MAG: hypothetical protein V4627_13910 [Pseudomonadota bacterium]